MENFILLLDIMRNNFAQIEENLVEFQKHF